MGIYVCVCRQVCGCLGRGLSKSDDLVTKMLSYFPTKNMVTFIHLCMYAYMRCDETIFFKKYCQSYAAKEYRIGEMSELDQYWPSEMSSLQ